MPSGITVYNDTGIVQIDETSQVNLGLRSLGWLSLTTVVSTNGGECRYADIAITNGSAPFVVLRAEDHYNIAGYGIVGTYTVGSTVYVRVAAAINAGAVGTAIWTLKYWAFDKPLASSSGIGIEVYDATGAIKYSSSYRPMSIAHIGSGTYNSTRVYGIACNAYLQETVTIDPSMITDSRETFFYGGAITNSTGTVTAPDDSAPVLVEGANWPSGTTMPPSINFGLGMNFVSSGSSIVCDMTGWGLIGDAPPI